MPILKHSDIIQPGKVFADLQKEIDGLTLSLTKLQKQTQAMNKSGSGAEAKARLELTKKLTTETNNLISTETKRERLIQAKIRTEQQSLRIETQKAKEIERTNKIQERAVRVTEKLRVAKEKENREYVKQSKRLNDLRNKYKDLILTEGKATVQTTKLKNEITKLDSKLKAVDKSVGQSQREVGKYGNALKGLGTQLLGAAGITVGLSAVVQGMKAVGERANILIDVTKKIEQTFNEAGGSAKKLAADVVALANNFDEDYNEILKAANTVSKELGISATEALANIEEGFLKGSNNTGEFLDILKEYPTQFKAAGIDAQTMFSIINQQVKEGIYSDKGVDAIKEGGLRLRENTKAVQEALAPLDESIRLQIEQEVAAGNSFKAIQLVSESLKDTSLTAEETQAIIADVFGGAGEDAGIRYLQLLSDIEGDLKNVAVQSTESEQANLKLSKAWNSFVGEAFSDAGIFAKAWNHVKTAVTNALDQINVLIELFSDKKGKRLKATKEINSLGRATSELAEETKDLVKTEKELKEEADEAAKALKRQESAAASLYRQLKANNLLRDDNLTFKETQEADKRDAESMLDADEGISVDPISAQPTGLFVGVGGDAELVAVAEFEDKKNEVKLEKLLEYQEQSKEAKLANEEAEREEELARLEEWEAAKNTVREAAIDTFGQFASQASQAFANDKISKAKQDNKAEQALLKDKLQKGQITEAQFKRQSAAADKKARQEQAKAQRDAALFDIVISTAVGVIKAIANTGLPLAAPLIVATIALGALNAALVLSQPLPSFGKGEVGIKGKSHSQGGKAINVEGGESIITTEGTANAPGLLTAINEGAISDSDLPSLVSKGMASNNFNPSTNKNDGLIASLLIKGNKKADKMNTTLLNGVNQYEINGIKHIIFADGRHFTQINE